MEAGSSKAGHVSPPLQHQQIYAEIDKFYPAAAAGDQQIYCTVQDSAVKRSIGSTTGCTITEKAPTRAFSWLKAPTSAFTFKTLLTPFCRELIFPI